MPSFNTNTKLQFARVLYGVVNFFRKLLGMQDNLVICRRGGLSWELQLREGIDLSIYLFGAFERETEKTIRQKLFPNATVLDIGANIGAIALPMARQVGPQGRVYAIEATQWAFQRLLRNKDLNPSLSDSLVPVHAVLLESESGVKPSEIHSSWDLFSKSVHPVHGGTLSSTEGAQTLTLDALVDRLGLTKIDFVKMDVDGFEVKVLRGARKTFARFKPPMIMELAPYALEEQGASLEELLELISEMGYRPPGEAQFLRKIIPAGGGINVVIQKM
jgi:FkbM family methyltransferase